MLSFSLYCQHGQPARKTLLDHSLDHLALTSMNMARFLFLEDAVIETVK